MHIYGLYSYHPVNTGREIGKISEKIPLYAKHP